MKDLSVVVDGMTFDNPFVIGSGPPGTNKRTIAKSFDEGWGGVVCKTISLESQKVINTAPPLWTTQKSKKRRNHRL
jgi:dihydroorotate dehydrogenase